MLKLLASAAETLAPTQEQRPGVAIVDVVVGARCTCSCCCCCCCWRIDTYQLFAKIQGVVTRHAPYFRDGKNHKKKTDNTGDVQRFLHFSWRTMAVRMACRSVTRRAMARSWHGRGHRQSDATGVSWHVMRVHGISWAFVGFHELSWAFVAMRWRRHVYSWHCHRVSHGIDCHGML